MPEIQQNFGTMRRYMPAVLRQNCMGWYIEYYAYNQISQGLERKRMRVNRERKMRTHVCGVPFYDNADDCSNQLPVSKRLVTLCNFFNPTSTTFYAGCNAAYATTHTASCTACSTAVPHCSGNGCTAKAYR